MDNLIGGRFDINLFSCLWAITRLRARKLLGVPIQLQHLLTEATFSLATIPHDKLYALLGVAGDTDQRALRPRYDLPFESAYCNYTTWFASTQERALHMLCQAKAADSRLNLPSWVPLER